MTKRKDVYQVSYDLGKHYLESIPPGSNYGVMFDIDDTLIFSKSGKPIKPIIKLLKLCNKLDILVLIVTARSSIYRKETIEELEYNGIFDRYGTSSKNKAYYDYLYLRNSPQDDNVFFKSNVKKELLTKHDVYTIMSIGDNEVDIVGEYSGYCIKLPNIHDQRLFHKDATSKMVEVTI